MPREEDPVPRVLLMGWCFYLLAAWGVVNAWGPPAERPRWLVLLAVIGMMALWPAYRLSQGRVEAGPRPRRFQPWQVLLDWVGLVAILQVVLWVLRLSARWTVGQTVLIDLGLAGWSLLSGLLVAAGCLSERGGVRTAAMVGCLLLPAGEPLLLMGLDLLAGGHGLTWPMRVSPFEALWALTEPPARWQPGPWPAVIAGVAGAGAAGWLLLALARLGFRRSSHEGAAADSAGRATDEP